MEIQPHLDTLELSGLIRLAQTEPDMAYLLRHALVQDAAYDSLLVRDRQQLHRIVGETLERLHCDRPDELSPMLAQHFYNAGDDERALKYFTLAGDAALCVYANIEAIDHYSQALKIAGHIGTLSPKLESLYSNCGRALELSGQHQQAWRN